MEKSFWFFMEVELLPKRKGMGDRNYGTVRMKVNCLFPPLGCFCKACNSFIFRDLTCFN